MPELTAPDVEDPTGPSTPDARARMIDVLSPRRHRGWAVQVKGSESMDQGVAT
jgi:hypothetical protein